MRSDSTQEFNLKYNSKASWFLCDFTSWKTSLWKLYKSDTNRNDGHVLLPRTTGSAEESSETGALHLVSPLLPQSVRKYSEDLRVQQLCLLQPRQLLSQFHLQAVASAEFPFQMLNGANASGGRKRRAQLLLALPPANTHPSVDEPTSTGPTPWWRRGRTRPPPPPCSASWGWLHAAGSWTQHVSPSCTKKAKGSDVLQI